MRRLLVFTTCFIFSIWVLPADPQVERVGIAGTDLVVEIHKTHAHLFLAEYDFKMVLTAGGENLDSEELASDTGGLSRIEVLWIDQRTIGFRDHISTTCLDIQKEKFKYCSSDTVGQRLGYFDFDADRHWRFIRRDGGGVVK